ncbi:uncharacterized protein SCDLUD_005162 [Saccharomycodes ludwigii]|uniref:uncharacterized protein n=1 Tax=Saccharomycodes ludwigii TaxID=36035 RepID=UPI001E86837B|nr:hypothetical protein SCDLUD_005162 [Saccharomycodes ludwigii]KAH3898824.1 hypothetical protein SCDLUD_005162 [Saccharomycodes ludwigii]
MSELARISDKSFNELCYACRVGDVENADKLISLGVPLNGVDMFDNSPLFLASLCGHENVVKLLLERGAVCDRDRHEGARCIYGALTDKIRSILLRHDLSRAFDLNQPFAKHISSLYIDDNDKSANTNLLFKDAGLSFGSVLTHSPPENQKHEHSHRYKLTKVNKFILVASSSYFSEKFKDAKNEIYFEIYPDLILREVDFLEATELFVKFLYLIPVLHLFEKRHLNILCIFAEKMKFPILKEYIEKLSFIVDPNFKHNLIVEYQKKITEDYRRNFLNFVENNIIKKCLTVDQDSFKDPSFASKIIAQVRNNSCAYPDIILSVKNTETKKITLYPAHRAMLSRSEYFKTMFTLPFCENNCYLFDNDYMLLSLSDPTVVDLPTEDIETAHAILKYLYYDNTDIPWEIAMRVLVTADFLLLDRLKTMAAVSITSHGNEFLKIYSLFDILYIAWEVRMERLEHFVAKTIADNLEKYQDLPSFHQAIENSAKRISKREDSDTIELIDDIMYYLLRKHDLTHEDLELLDFKDDLEFMQESGLYSYQKDVAIIEKVLSKLKLHSCIQTVDFNFPLSYNIH